MAFYNCSALTSITLPENVTIVGAEAFYGCTALTAATILNTSTTLGYGSNTFYGVPAAFAIYGYKSSTAETYASDNGHAFVDLNAEPEKEIVPGDCDGDGKVSMNDLTLLAKYLAGHDVTLG